MSVTDLSLFSLLKSRMHWSQSRQKLLSENVANADTPGFKPTDLAPFAQSAAALAQGTVVRPVLTHPAHQILGGAGGAFDAAHGMKFEVRPAGNAVNLEDEMMKVAENQMDFQAVTSLYGRSLGLLKTAMGRRA